MAYVQVDRGGAICASAFAGPLFVTAVAAATLYLTLPAPIVIRPFELAGFALLLFPATIVGFVIALLPNLIGSGLLALAARHIAPVRYPPVWMLVGGGLGFGIARLFEATSGPVAFGLVITSAVCALICRRSITFA